MFANKIEKMLLTSHSSFRWREEQEERGSGKTLSAFTDLNFTEIMGGLVLNLKIDFNL